MSIRKLPDELVQQLRSGIVISSIQQCVVELVQNALDAQATVIQVLVNAPAASVQVVDNGLGIDPCCFKLLGQRYATSKMGNESGTQSFGFRGEALASIAEVSRVEITSRSNYLQTYTLTLQSGKQTLRPSSVARRRGTTVTVIDLFYKYPVRRKLLMSENCIESVKRVLESIVLSVPHVTCTLHDESRNIQVLATRKDLSPVTHERDGYTLEGFFSTKGFPSKYHQYIYVNNHYMFPNALHVTVNRLIAKSKFGAQNDEDEAFPTQSGTSPQKYKYSVKVTDRFPIFLLKLKCPPDTTDVLLDPNKNMVEFRFFEDVTTRFLVQHGFENDSMDIDSLLGEASGGESDESAECNTPLMPTVANELPSTGPLAQPLPSPSQVREHLPSGAEPSETIAMAPALSETTVTRAGEEYALWKDPNTKRSHDITDVKALNPEVHRYYVLPGETQLSSDSRQQKKLVDNQKLRGKTIEAASSGVFGKLKFDDSLRKWKNPVFKRSERSLPQLGTRMGENRVNSFADKASKVFNGLPAGEVMESISKGMLDTLRVISQVDRKFILCKMDSTNAHDSEVLIMVDQHAADERVGLEVLLEELYRPGDEGESTSSTEPKVDTVRLDPSCRILMSAREAHAATRHSARFSRWGISFKCLEIAAETESGEQALMKPDLSVRVDVVELPKLIADRCVVDPGVIKDVIRQYVFWLEEGNIGAGVDGQCPKGILEILHSKACRSAIMFGDALTVEQCEGLIEKLKKCKFPFQCGRCLHNPGSCLQPSIDYTTTYQLMDGPLTAVVIPLCVLTVVPAVVVALLVEFPLLRPALIVYVLWYSFFDDDPWKGGGNRPSVAWKNRLFMPNHMRDYACAQLHKDAEVDPKAGPFLMGLHPHGILCYSHFVNVITDVSGFPELFPNIERRVAVLDLLFRLPILREIALIHGLISVNKSSIKYWLSQGTNKAVGIVVGGAAESLESFDGVHRVILKRRRGFFRLALETGSALIPVYSFGETSLWSQLQHPVLCKLQKLLLRLTGFTIPVCYGRWFTPIPNQIELVTVVGKPISVTKIQSPTDAQIEDLQRVYIVALTELFDKYKDKYAKNRIEDLKIVH
ncbi:diacylglycerol acyltransferase-domain-containing protein [Powellomyces hirtus]|nr:diacylglycerol acyltransferase-domain-containing protein [Powellomyces hirtus]